MILSPKRLAALLGAAALLLPAAADAKSAHAGKGQQKAAVTAKAKHAGKAKRGKGHAKPRTVVLAGKVVSAGADQVVVAVSRGNRAARRAGLTGTQVTFTLATARIVVADVDGDGTADGRDLAAGDVVVVSARLPRTATAADGPFAARKVVDLTHPPVDEDEREDEGETQAPAEAPPTA